ncbi:MAG: histidine phosphatase family protein [Candidatus Thalassarchaeaceae archaeon]|nr:histidine phosphatase family protein [Candidatus Thalassarchaeaceae archaeon]MDP7003474.1 histidine phosphatase family protein [Candidatus Thalassarchaeaceae archaeon]
MPRSERLDGGAARRLIVMRHAKSSWDHPELRDHDRPLNRRGQRDAPRMADALAERGWAPELILVSSATRTRETLEGMSRQFGDVTTEVRPGIYHAGVHDLMLELQDMLEEGTTMILGHNPGSEMLVNHLSGQWHVMPTAAAVMLVASADGWTVEEVLRPKEL